MCSPKLLAQLYTFYGVNFMIAKHNHINLVLLCHNSPLSIWLECYTLRLVSHQVMHDQAATCKSAHQPIAVKPAYFKAYACLLEMHQVLIHVQLAMLFKTDLYLLMGINPDEKQWFMKTRINNKTRGHRYLSLVDASRPHQSVQLLHPGQFPRLSDTWRVPTKLV